MGELERLVCERLKGYKARTLFNHSTLIRLNGFGLTLTVFAGTTVGDFYYQRLLGVEYAGTTACHGTKDLYCPICWG